MQKFSAEREQISDETLNIMLSKFIEKMEKFDFVMYPTFKIMYDHGFRIKEVLEANKRQRKEHTSSKFMPMHTKRDEYKKVHERVQTPLV